MKNTLVISLMILILPFLVQAAPNVSNVSGTVSHGSQITINGTEFGTRMIATPSLWDTAEDKAIDNPSEVTGAGPWN